MSSPLVSVVVPTHNRAQMVERCLEALAAQTYTAFEVIVVDDGSRDDTQQVLARFAQRHPQLALTLLKNDPQRGANASRNRGISASRGSLIAFEDDDCEADPGWVAGLAASFVSERVGAVTGTVHDPEPKNIYDLAFGGTHRVYGVAREGALHATRLVGCNMCVRRALLEGKLDEDRAAVTSDTSVSGRGDEEDLYLKLKAEGHEVHVAPQAAVLHVHHYSRRSFFRQAYRGGGSAARLGYKYHLPLRPELMCLAGGYVFAAGAVVNPLALVPSAGCFGLFAAAALVYNEIWRKKKTPLQALRVAPVMTAYYHARTWGYVRQMARLRLGIDRMERVRLTSMMSKAAG
jgi:glycosyltransferase involved in cell wall biosynthesis